MMDNTQTEASKLQATGAGMRGEIQQKWGKFSARRSPPSRTRAIW